MAAAVTNQMARASDSDAAVKSVGIDIGYRWIDDITIELAGERPRSKLQLKVSTNTERQEYKTRTSNGTTIRRVSTEKIPCDKTKEVTVELFKQKRKYMVRKENVQIISLKVTLEDDELYTKKTFTSDDNGASVTIIFAYTPAGELREGVQDARRITEEQKVILDKVRHVHRFLQGLGTVCGAVEDAGSTAILSLYKLCEKQKEYRDAARGLVDEMYDFSNSGTEGLGDVLRTNPTTRAAFKALVSVVEDIPKFVEEHSIETMSGLLRGAVSTNYETKLAELRDRLGRTKESLRDSISFGTWERVMDADLRSKLDCVLKAHYSSGEGCLKHTRKNLLADVDIWMHEPNTEKVAWVHGYAGSGKSALLNSIAENLENAGIPFTCFPCKRDDPELSNLHRILPTIAYILTEYYGDYRGIVSDAVKKPTGHSISTGDVKKQAELLLGKAYDAISPKGSSRPPVHVLLIDAFDECRNHRNGSKTVHERRTLLEILLDFADTVPWIKVLITSRPEPDITDVFKDTRCSIHRIDINEEKWGTSADIRVFIEAKSEELKLGLSLDEIDRFEKKASGLYIWCTTVFRYIEESKESRSRTVANILEGQSPDSADNPLVPLYSLYKHILNSILSDACDKELMEIVLEVVFVASSRKPLSTTAMTAILFPNERGKELEEKRKWVNNGVKALSAFIYVEEGETNAVRARHSSFLDYLSRKLSGKPAAMIVLGDNTDKALSARLEEIHTRVFEGCFEVMRNELRFNICGLEEPFRLNDDVPDLPTRIKQNIPEALQYASLFWVSHLKGCNKKESDERIYEFLNSRIVLFWVEALSLLNATDRGIDALQDCAKIFSTEPNVAGTANEWERFLHAYGDALKSTPHLYLSASSWIPTSSPLREIISSSFLSNPSIILNVPEDWKGERWLESVGMRVLCVTYSFDGHLFAAGCKDGSILFWDARSKKRVRESFMTESDVFSIAFSPNGHWLASGHYNGDIRLWDLRAGSAVSRVLGGHTEMVYSVAFSSKGSRIVSGAGDTSIRVWDVDSGIAVGEPLRGHNSSVTSATFSADSTRIISASYDETVRIWNMKTGGQIRELQGHSVTCSRDGRLIASSCTDGTIRLWDAQTYEQLGSLISHTSRVNSVCFSLDSKHIASVSDGFSESVRVWNVDTRSMVSELKGHMRRVWTVTFSPDGRSLLSGSEDGTIRIWDLKETSLINRPPADNLAGMTYLSYLPGNNRLVSISQDRSLKFWDTRTGAAVGNPIQNHIAEVIALAVSRDGQWFVSVSADQTFRIWDNSSGTMIKELTLGDTERVNSVAVSPDNQFVAFASDDRTVRLWDVETHKSLKTLKGHEGEVTSVTFSSDGNSVVSGSSDCTIRIWDTRTGDSVREPLRGHSFGVEAVVVSPDGQWIASRSIDNNVRIWSMSTLSVIHVLKGHFSPVTSVSFSQNSLYLISGSHDKTVRIWDIQTGKVVGKPLMGHTDSIYSVAFAPDGLEFASASKDGTIRVWDALARTDLEVQKKSVKDYHNPDETELPVLWNSSRACATGDDGWIKDQDKLLLWVPWQYRHDIYGGTRLVIGAQSSDTVRPQVDYGNLFRYRGKRWTDINTGRVLSTAS